MLKIALEPRVISTPQEAYHLITWLHTMLMDSQWPVKSIINPSAWLKSIDIPCVRLPIKNSLLCKKSQRIIGKIIWMILVVLLDWPQDHPFGICLELTLQQITRSKWIISLTGISHNRVSKVVVHSLTYNLEWPIMMSWTKLMLWLFPQSAQINPPLFRQAFLTSVRLLIMREAMKTSITITMWR